MGGEQECEGSQIYILDSGQASGIKDMEDKKTLLIVEDDKYIINFISMTLKRKNMRSLLPSLWKRQSACFMPISRI